MSTLNSHEDLDAWRLATELKEWVFRIIKRPQVARDFKFCDDIKRSARSAPANLSEGFWRYRPRDNAKFVRVALGSLGETHNHLRDAFTEKYIDENEYKGIRALNERALKAAVGWHTYLMSCPERGHPSVRRGRRAESVTKAQPQADNEELQTTNEEPETNNEPDPRTKNEEPKRKTKNPKRKTDQR
jgi:four helix bundle protein